MTTSTEASLPVGVKTNPSTVRRPTAMGATPKMEAKTINGTLATKRATANRSTAERALGAREPEMRLMVAVAG